MAWIDNKGEVRPSSWEEYCAMKDDPPWWMKNSTVVLQSAEETYRPIRLHNANRGVKLRVRLHLADPHCFWCGQRTYINVAHAQHNLATVDHLYSRLHPRRSSHNYEQANVLHVLACYKCNHRRSVCEQQRVPFIPALRERLEFAQRADATLAPRNPEVEDPVKESDEATEATVKTLKEEFLHAARPVLLRRKIQTLEEAIKFARENPAR